MKKHLTSILLLLLPAVLIIYAPQAVRGASAGLVLWFNQVLPVLFPFALILQLIMSANALSGISCLTAPIMQKCLHLSPAWAYDVVAYHRHAVSAFLQDFYAVFQWEQPYLFRHLKTG